MHSIIKATAVASPSVLFAGAFFSVPSYAIDGGVTPPECALASTKAHHPDWYRPGGYCTPNLGLQPGFAEVHHCMWKP